MKFAVKQDQDLQIGPAAFTIPEVSGIFPTTLQKWRGNNAWA